MIIILFLFACYRRRHTSSSSNAGSRAYLRYSQSEAGHPESRLARLIGGRDSRAGSRMSDNSFISDTVRARGYQISNPMPLMVERQRDARFHDFATGPTPPIADGTGPTFTGTQKMPATASSRALALAHTLGRGHDHQLSYDSTTEDIQSPFADPPAAINGRNGRRPSPSPNPNPRRITTDSGDAEYQSSNHRPVSGAVTPESQYSRRSESLYSTDEGNLGPFEDVVIPSPSDTLQPPRPSRV